MNDLKIKAYGKNYEEKSKILLMKASLLHFSKNYEEALKIATYIIQVEKDD